MKTKLLILVVASLWMNSCDTNNEDVIIEPPTPEEPTELTFIDAFPDIVFNQPIDIQFSPDDTNRLFVVEKKGKIVVFENDISTIGSDFLNIESQVDSGGEQGLLGLAFHPDFENNNVFYVYYNPSADVSRISRFEVSSGNIDEANISSESVILEFFQDATNHNGGQLAFGADGYLYISSGDGGPQVNGQDLTTLTGNILRIDVDSSGGGLNYGIPTDNPFINDNNARDEIYAYGLRNPWRMSFDRMTNKLWLGDVGSGFIEEVNIIDIGKNYGWSTYEGTMCRFGPCDASDDVVFPVFEYERNPSGSAVTGGYVYRGSLNSELTNKYVYGDFVEGKIWILDISTFENELLFDTNYRISCFGIDKDNELYFADFSGGKIYKFDRD